MSTAISERVAQFQVTGTINPKASDGIAKTISSMWGSTKNVADLMGLLSKGAKFLSSLVPDAAKPYISHIEEGAGDTRSWLSVPYAATVAQKFREEPTVRNGVEGGKIIGFSLAALLPDAGLIPKIAGIFGVTLDFIDLGHEFEAQATYTDLSNVQTSPEAKQIIDDKLWQSTCKILKLALTLFAGVVATGAWIFGLAIPTALATTALVASIGALALSFSIAYADHNTEWKAKITPVTV
jgi:hypothetical protein